MSRIDNRKKGSHLKFYFILIFVFSSLIVYSFFRSDSDSPEVDERLSRVEKEALISVKNFSQTSSKNGITEIILKADLAQIFQSDNSMIFKKIDFTYFNSEGGKISVTAKQGNLNMKTKNVKISGNIKIKNDGLVVETQSLFYKDKERILYSTKPVKIVRGDSIITARLLNIDLKTNKMRLDGDVQKVFSEKFKL